MKYSLLLMMFAMLASSLVGQSVKVRVVDETGAALENVRVGVGFLLGRDEDDHIGLTDRYGFYSAEGRGLMGVYLGASKEGYYAARFETFPPNKDIDQLIVLPRVLNPSALYANRSYAARGNNLLKFPAQNQWFGYDFQTRDWVQPYGGGENTDILFRFKSTFRGYLESIKNLDDEIAFSKRVFAGRHEAWTEDKFKQRAGKWDAELEIAFPGNKEGMHEEEARYIAYSRLKLPHEAPADGYMPTWHYTINNYTPTTIRDNVGFFLRTRVKLDQNGHIVSANYSKIIGDFRPDVQGTLEFNYYFNPVLNDRNLEFDPTKNLFPTNLPGSNVGDP